MCLRPPSRAPPASSVYGGPSRTIGSTFDSTMVQLDPAVDFRNNVVASNDVTTGVAAFNLTIQYNDVYGHPMNASGNVVFGAGSLSADPGFMDAAGGDYTLDPLLSPCVDAGDPGDDDADGSRNDMGAFGGPGGGWTVP